MAEVRRYPRNFVHTAVVELHLSCGVGLCVYLYL